MTTSRLFPFNAHHVHHHLLRVSLLMCSAITLAGCYNELMIEKRPAVCETRERMAGVRTTQISDPIKGSSTRWEVVTVDQELDEYNVVWRGEDEPLALSYHCGTGRVAVLHGDETSARITVVSERGSRVAGVDVESKKRNTFLSETGHTLTTIDVGSQARSFALSPDGSMVSLKDKATQWGRVRVWSATDGKLRMNIPFVESAAPFPWMWAKDSLGIFTVHSFSGTPVKAPLVFHPLEAGKAPTSYPVCSPEEGMVSSTVGHCTANGKCFGEDKPWLELGDLVPTLPRLPVRRPLESYEDDDVGSFHGVEWQSVPNMAFPVCPSLFSGMRLRMFLENLALARCDHEDRCTNVRPRTYSGRWACHAAAEDELTFAMLHLDAMYELADAKRAEACVVKYREMACTQTVAEMEKDADCRAALRFRHAAGTGAACTVGTQHAGQGVHCERGDERCVPDSSINGCGVCSAPLADGQPCTQSRQCESALCVEGACISPVQKDGACHASVECAHGLVCRSGRCQGRAEMDGTCRMTVEVHGTTYPGDDCQLDLACINGTCRRPEEPTECAWPRGLPCSHGCGLEPGPAALGTCGLLAADPGSSAFCPLEHGLERQYCQSVPASTPITACNCKPLLAGGVPCKNYQDCASGVCMGNWVHDKQDYCGDLLADGQTCRDHRECRSGSCDMVSDPNAPRCVASMMCQ